MTTRVIVRNRLGNALAVAVVALFALAVAAGLAVGGAYLCWWLIPGVVGVAVSAIFGGALGALLVILGHRAWEMWS